MEGLKQLTLFEMVAELNNLVTTSLSSLNPLLAQTLTHSQKILDLVASIACAQRLIETLKQDLDNLTSQIAVYNTQLDGVKNLWDDMIRKTTRTTLQISVSNVEAAKLSEQKYNATHTEVDYLTLYETEFAQLRAKLEELNKATCDTTKRIGEAEDNLNGLECQLSIAESNLNTCQKKLYANAHFDLVFTLVSMRKHEEFAKLNVN